MGKMQKNAFYKKITATEHTVSAAAKKYVILRSVNSEESHR